MNKKSDDITTQISKFKEGLNAAVFIKSLRSYAEFQDMLSMRYKLMYHDSRDDNDTIAMFQCKKQRNNYLRQVKRLEEGNKS